MKVRVLFKSGAVREIPIPETKWSSPTAAQAIEYAKDRLMPSEREKVKSYEVEEDFI